MLNDSNRVYKVIIVDDHALFADGMELIINNTPGFNVIGKASNGKLLMQNLNWTHPDLILLDINMLLMDGLEAAIAIKRKFKDIKIVFISQYYDVRYKAFIKQHNIDGFVIKDSGAKELKDALRKVISGEKVFILPPEKSSLVVPIEETGFMKKHKLTKAEIRIIQLIAAGHSTKIIADKLNLKNVTVETHRKNIFRKLNAKNMADVVAFAVFEGLYTNR